MRYRVVISVLNQFAPELPSVRNRVNLGCGGAWTQGAILRRGWFHGVCLLRSGGQWQDANYL